MVAPCVCTQRLHTASVESQGQLPLFSSSSLLFVCHSHEPYLTGVACRRDHLFLNNCAVDVIMQKNPKNFIVIEISFPLLFL